MKLTRWGLTPQPPDHPSDEHSNEPPRLALFNDTYAIFFLIFFRKAYVSGTHLRLLEAIQMSTNNICFYKEADKSI